MKAAEMFKVLLADARSRDVIQTSFDTLTEHLEGASDRARMSSCALTRGRRKYVAGF